MSDPALDIAIGTEASRDWQAREPRRWALGRRHATGCQADGVGVPGLVPAGGVISQPVKMRCGPFDPASSTARRLGERP